MRAICRLRVATSVAVVSPTSGSPRSAEITAPEMYTPSKPFSSMSRADSGLKAPGKRSSPPPASPDRSVARFWAAVEVAYSIRRSPRVW
ncbi:hypothetical protein CAE01nite_08250 [Cellulomonas aerilata]|uniref:Uncharacterized protein n=1 Tax=Cellulomonas aerilata TaxID=515326 RepID=A0A512DA24_9CELL|nr:hypothetical protein CAE01nite_08250 [Cellulomonas aerilata]